MLLERKSASILDCKILHYLQRKTAQGRLQCGFYANAGRKWSKTKRNNGIGEEVVDFVNLIELVFEIEETELSFGLCHYRYGNGWCRRGKRDMCDYHSAIFPPVECPNACFSRFMRNFQKCPKFI